MYFEIASISLNKQACNSIHIYIISNMYFTYSKQSASDFNHTAKYAYYMDAFLRSCCVRYGVASSAVVRHMLIIIKHIPVSVT